MIFWGVSQTVSNWPLQNERYKKLFLYFFSWCNQSYQAQNHNDIFKFDGLIGKNTQFAIFFNLAFSCFLPLIQPIFCFLRLVATGEKSMNTTFGYLSISGCYQQKLLSKLLVFHDLFYILGPNEFRNAYKFFRQCFWSPGQGSFPVCWSL